MKHEILIEELKNFNKNNIEIVVNDKMGEDFLFNNKYLILTNKTYNYIKENHSELIEGIKIRRNKKIILIENELEFEKIDNNWIARCPRKKKKLIITNETVAKTLEEIDDSFTTIDNFHILLIAALTEIEKGEINEI